DMSRSEIEALLGEAPRHRSSMQEHSEMKPFSAVPARSTPTFEEDLAFITRELESAGLGSVVVVDCSKRAGLHVVRVVVPGLEAPYYLPGYRRGPRALAARAQRGLA